MISERLLSLLEDASRMVAFTGFAAGCTVIDFKAFLVIMKREQMTGNLQIKRSI